MQSPDGGTKTPAAPPKSEGPDVAAAVAADYAGKSDGVSPSLRKRESLPSESAAAAAATKTPDSTSYVIITDNKVAIAYTSGFFQKSFFSS